MELRREYYAPESRAKTVQEVFDCLDRWCQRNAGHHSEKRAAKRFDYREQIAVTVTSLKSGEVITFHPWARNLSVSGMAFLVAGLLEPRELYDESRALIAGSVLHPGRKITIELPRAEGGTMMLISEVVRFREVHNGLFECGVRFLERGDCPINSQRKHEEGEFQFE